MVLASPVADATSRVREASEGLDLAQASRLNFVPRFGAEGTQHMDIQTILKNVADVSSRFAAERPERQQRRALVAADFGVLRDAGFLLTGVPVEEGGVWQDVRRSARPICEILRILAHGDPAVALVCAMHPTVLAFWLASPTALPPFQEAWAK